MAILSLFAITLLTSVHAFDLPSPSEVLSKVQRRHSAIKASVQDSVSSLSGLSAELSSIPEDIKRSIAAYHASPTLPNLMQTMDSAECAAAMNQSCLANFNTALLMTMSAPNATAAVAYAEQYCEACDDPAAQMETVVEDCGLEGDSLVMYSLMISLAEAACVDPECSGELLWAFPDMMERRDSFCPNLECGLPLISAFTNFSSNGMSNDTDVQCSGLGLQLSCLTDEDDETVYCVDFLGDNGVNSTEFCATSCPGYMTVMMQESAAAGCNMMGGDDDDDDECDDEDYMPPSLNDMCIRNEDGEYCADIFMSEESAPNVSACPALGTPFEIPAPGVSPGDAECSDECSAQLASSTELPIGCCFASFLDFSCIAEEPMTFITDTCDVTLDTCEIPELPAATPTEEESSEETDGGVVTGVSGGVAVVLVATSLFALL